ncbi:cytochrome-c peroxidase [Tabrizicola sp.]|uniref:cytochrome-c peroxidase n=1 Tax=Tabrizicola sp. TaxID=2005166 RepID=UPI002734C613|nr:cytochrome c peroxidase [Tabrizicola sp.]MDP3196915.1 cytochrome c peroxidase [Tabrizicola sp.]
MRTSTVIVAALVIGSAAAAWWTLAKPQPWTEEETRLVQSLGLASLPPLPADPSNAVAVDPDAASLGKALFFDTRLSANNKVACGTCHLPDRQFQDDLPRAKGVGETARRTMPIAGTAYSPWVFWDGRKDSQWAQALGPLESAVEHGTDRAYIAHLIEAHYADQYAALFGPLPTLDAVPDHASPNGLGAVLEDWLALDESQKDAINRVFADVGKAIAAYERTITPQPSRFDAYVDHLAAGEDTSGILSDQEEDGLRLFVGKGECTKCHNGPLLTDNFFHNTGVTAVPGLPGDLGRSVAVEQVLADPFNCLGPYSDAGPGDCAELRYLGQAGHEMIRAYKPPSLRGVASRPPYMHAGQIATLGEVLVHYNTAPAAPDGHSELAPLNLNPTELAALEAFLGALDPIEGQP